MSKPIQKILFGSPGTGKSYKVNTEYLNELDIEKGSVNHIPVVFHPEYTYGDFIGKLMPFSRNVEDGKMRVEYHFYTGHFLKALGRAYKAIILSHVEQAENVDKVTKEYKKEIGKTNIKSFLEEQKKELNKKKEAVKRLPPKNVLLVIDEINRGNSAAIFGTIFQLLDRNKAGWSEYSVQISDLEHIGLQKEMGFENIQYIKNSKREEDFMFNENKVDKKKYNDYLNFLFKDIEYDKIAFQDRKIIIPPNLHIVATMNTSDSSIYFMDNAFKRRWDWEFISPAIPESEQPEELKNKKIKMYGSIEKSWTVFVDKLNLFIRSSYQLGRKIEDKQIGYFFIDDDGDISEESIKSKLMFFIWDSVFQNNKRPLIELLWKEGNFSDNERKLVTFGQFVEEDNVKLFVEKIINFQSNI